MPRALQIKSSKGELFEVLLASDPRDQKVGVDPEDLTGERFAVWSSWADVECLKRDLEN